MFRDTKPEIVFHLAAQPLVRASYRDPVGTYSTNVMGTVHLLECVRSCGSVQSVVNVTTDKVYRSLERADGFREDDVLDGYEPYANSKSCSELIAGAYVRSFLMERGQAIPVRNPRSVRPYQHVLEPLSVYLLIAKAQYEAPERAGAYNVGPNAEDCLATGELVELFCRCWGEGARWTAAPDGGPHEAGYLRLDCAKIKSALGWTPLWSARLAVEQTVAWTKAVLAGEDAGEIAHSQIRAYFTELEEKQHG